MIKCDNPAKGLSGVTTYYEYSINIFYYWGFANRCKKVPYK